jgi:hypothetical protein
MKKLEAQIAEEISPDSDVSGELPAKQELALLAVISHATLKEASLAAGISETTLWRYMQDKAFARRLREARRDAINHAAVRLQQVSSDAVSVLSDLMMKETAPAAARISAARTVLDYSFRVVEIDELKSRMEELEEFLKIKLDEDASEASSKGGENQR